MPAAIRSHADLDRCMVAVRMYSQALGAGGCTDRQTTLQKADKYVHNQAPVWAFLLAVIPFVLSRHGVLNFVAQRVGILGRFERLVVPLPHALWVCGLRGVLGFCHVVMCRKGGSWAELGVPWISSGSLCAALLV